MRHVVSLAVMQGVVRQRWAQDRVREKMVDDAGPSPFGSLETEEKEMVEEEPCLGEDGDTHHTMDEVVGRELVPCPAEEGDGAMET